MKACKNADTSMLLYSHSLCSVQIFITFKFFYKCILTYVIWTYMYRKRNIIIRNSGTLKVNSFLFREPFSTMNVLSKIKVKICVSSYGPAFDKRRK